ncbi:MAG: peptide ABC transporter ATP-binding protein [Ideonella sp. MAG2]|nr:MAG: peptide ABC transporter ATP-binding protein [Ideonella sp. MAG2]
MSTTLLEVQSLSQRYALPRGAGWQRPMVQALQSVSFSLQAGRNLGVVGESGSGKSTLARLVCALEVPHSGSVSFQGQNLHQLSAQALRGARKGFQMVFQDPFGSLDPRMRIGPSIAEPLRGLGATPESEQAARVAEMLEAVGLPATDADRYPHEFSGGQRQRIAIARALITRPQLIVADEPVSALDVSVQAQVLNLMQDLQDRYGLTYLFISHDLAVIELMCDDVLVLQHGQVVEQGPCQEVLGQPRHPYTQSLLAAARAP